MRRAAKVDASHPEIVEALRVAGCSVWYMRGDKGAPDLLVGLDGETFAAETKPPKGGKRATELRPEQARWHREWRGSTVVVLRSAEDALRWVKQRRQMVTVSLMPVQPWTPTGAR